MMELVTGGSASGKSEYAESRVLSLGPARRIYLATMMPWDEESRDRIARHQRLRRTKDFETAECFTGLENFVPAGAKVDFEQTVILLECMSNLAANEQYLAGGTVKEIRRRIGNGIQHLQKLAGRIIIVTNEVFSDGTVYGRETEEYLQLLGAVNQDLTKLADTVTEVVYGIPVRVK